MPSGRQARPKRVFESNDASTTQVFRHRRGQHNPKVFRPRRGRHNLKRVFMRRSNGGPMLAINTVVAEGVDRQSSVDRNRAHRRSGESQTSAPSRLARVNEPRSPPWFPEPTRSTAHGGGLSQKRD